ncbi:hypothetical protein J7E32_11040 [Bacillus sp. ISL-55]|nr:hypothetical protein [Bacillus sp. ISL-55]
MTGFRLWSTKLSRKSRYCDRFQSAESKAVKKVQLDIRVPLLLTLKLFKLPKKVVQVSLNPDHKFT